MRFAPDPAFLGWGFRVRVRRVPPRERFAQLKASVVATLTADPDLLRASRGALARDVQARFAVSRGTADRVIRLARQAVQGRAAA